MIDFVATTLYAHGVFTVKTAEADAAREAKTERTVKDFIMMELVSLLRVGKGGGVMEA